MKVLIIVIVCILLVLFIITRVRHLKNQSESKLSIFEHPSTFEKPPIEMVSSNPKKEKPSELIVFPEIKNENDRA